MPGSSSVDARRARITEIGTALPETEASSRTGQHTAFRVRGKTFAYYVVDEHGDGRIAFLCKAPPGMQGQLVASDPKKYYLPKYMAHHGWIAIDLDAGTIDWGEIEALMRESYRQIAPKRLAALLDQPG